MLSQRSCNDAVYIFESTNHIMTLLIYMDYHGLLFNCLTYIMNVCIQICSLTTAAATTLTHPLLPSHCDLQTGNQVTTGTLPTMRLPL